ncbi:MAG: amidohydrolase family protein, partial [Planctomycetota bacterium]
MRGIATAAAAAAIFLGLTAAAARGDDPSCLIRGATILPIDAPALEGDVLVRGDRIVEVAKHIDAPAGATIVEAKGRFLIPGLIDVHAHIAEETVFPDLFVPHGVTTVRDLGNRLEVVKRLAANRDPSRPEVVYVGPILDGDPPTWPAISEVLDKPEQVAPLLKRLKDEGCGWFKVYENLSPEVYDAIVKEAKALGVRVVGHVPKAVKASHAIEAGQDTIEHLTHFAPELSRADVPPSFISELSGWTDIDGEKEKRFIELLVKHGTRLDPTRVVVRNFSQAMRGIKPKAPAERFVPRTLKETFWKFFDGRPRTAELDAAHDASLARATVFV